MKIADDPAAARPVIEYQPSLRSTKSRLPGGSFERARPVRLPPFDQVAPPSSLAQDVIAAGVSKLFVPAAGAARRRAASASTNATARIWSVPRFGAATSHCDTPLVVCRMAPSD